MKCNKKNLNESQNCLDEDQTVRATTATKPMCTVPSEILFAVTFMLNKDSVLDF